MAQVPHYLDGEERLEHWPLARRTVRMGAPAALGVGDLARAREHALAGRGPEAIGYIEYMYPSHLMMIEVTYEWCLRLHLALAGRRPVAEAEAVRTLAEEEWRQLATLSPDRPPLAALSERLSARWLAENLKSALEGKRSKMLSLPNPALTGELEDLRRRATDALRTGQRADGVAALERYYGHARAAHDALIEYLWAVSAAVGRVAGEEVVGEMLAAAFRSVPAVNMMWPALHAVTASDAAFFLAEHLRGHFSGAGREGAVEIIEEADCYRLVFDPCGSGGALRRRIAAVPPAAEATTRSAGTTTWGLPDVPSYCTHCMHNELRSIETIGFPRWVTEYDPDPMKPCGWTVYKDPNDIPARYFERLGLAKDPARFERTGGVMGKIRTVVGALGVMWRSR